MLGQRATVIRLKNAVSRSFSLVRTVISGSSGDVCLKNNVLGSGITVYNVILGQFNASFAIDGGSPQLYVRDNSCFDQSPLGCYNISVYNVQSLSFENHIVTIVLLDYSGSPSDLLFDYAVVNDTEPAVVMSSTSSSTTTTSTGSSKSSVAVCFSFFTCNRFLKLRTVVNI